MTDISDLREIADEAHGIPGEMGMREYSVALLVDAWSGAQPGEGTLTQRRIKLLVGGQNPKVRWLSQKEIVAASLPDGIIEIGPLTPKVGIAGVDVRALIGADLAQGNARYLEIAGPRFLFPTRCRVTAISADRALRVTLQCVPVAQ